MDKSSGQLMRISWLRERLVFTWSLFKLFLFTLHLFMPLVRVNPYFLGYFSRCLVIRVFSLFILVGGGATLIYVLVV